MPRLRPGWRRQSVFAVGILLILALLLRVNFRQGRVTGPSMEPTYRSGETVLVWKTVPRQSLKSGDVIILRDVNGDELIKRIALIRPWSLMPPAGSYTIAGSGRQIPNALLFAGYFHRIALGKQPVPPPENRVYVVGDNLLNSDDSRHFGPIRRDQILGKVVP